MGFYRSLNGTLLHFPAVSIRAFRTRWLYPPCTAYAAILCGLAIRKQFFAASKCNNEKSEFVELKHIWQNMSLEL